MKKYILTPITPLGNMVGNARKYLSGYSGHKNRLEFQSIKGKRPLLLRELENTITERLKAIPEEQANATYMARYFVESILTWEFGDEILQDPNFSHLSREVVETFKTNQPVWDQVQAMLGKLRSE